MTTDTIEIEEAPVADDATAKRFRALFDTALATANALATSPSVGTSHAHVAGSRFDEPEEAMPGVFGLQLEIIGGDSDVSIQYGMTADEYGFASIFKTTIVHSLEFIQTEDIWSEPVSTLTQATLASHFVNAVIGSPTIPPASRRSAASVEDAARGDAKYFFARGLQTLVASDVEVQLMYLDESDAWDLIVSAGQEDNHRHHMSMHRELSVPLSVIDIYDDAWFEAAGTLMSLLNPIGASGVRFAGEPESRW